MAFDCDKTWVAVRHWATALVLTTAVLAGCGKEEDLPIAAKPIAPSMISSDLIDSPKEYPTQWLGGKTLTVAPGVHVLGELFPSAAFAVETNEGVILIDTGGDEGGFELRECLLRVQLPAEQIRYILITHAHYDHVFGANKMRKMSGAVVCAGSDDCQTLRSADQDALFSLFPRRLFSGDPIEVDRELNDGDVIELGGVKILVIAAPGHTPGSVCYLLERDGKRILFSGDVIASLSFGPATYPVHISPKFRGDAVAYLATINRLLDMEPPDLLLTGHPQQHTRLHSIQMDPQSWNALLVPAKKELEQVISRHQRDGADFLDGAAKEIEPGLYYLGELDNTAVYCLVDGEQLIVINAPGGADFSQHLSTQLESLGLPPREPAVVLLTSDDASCRSGLESLTTRPRVVAPPSAFEPLRASGVDAVSHEAMNEIVTVPVEVIALDNMLSYLFSCGSKQVLVTPKVPRNIVLAWTNRENGRKTFGTLQPQFGDLMKEFSASPDSVKGYREALEQLAKYAPDVWLPALPLTGQNANLYDGDWQTTIDQNQRQLKKFRLP